MLWRTRRVILGALLIKLCYKVCIENMKNRFQNQLSVSKLTIIYCFTYYSVFYQQKLT